LSPHQTTTSATESTRVSSSKTRSRQSSYVSARTSASVNNETEESNQASNRTSTSSSDLSDLFLGEVIACPTSFSTDQTTTLSVIDTSENSSSSNHTSTSSAIPAEFSFTEALPSPASSPTGQTIPSLELQIGRRPFKLDEVIEIDNYCAKRKTGIARGQLWMDEFWGFESLQLLFIWKYGWKPDIERFEDFWLRRGDKTDFWLLWDYPTNLV
jgi:hypothetical protein